MSGVVSGCCAAASVLGEVSIGCDQCPFPFCVVAEADAIQAELRGQMARMLRSLGSSIEEAARTMNVTMRSVCRYTSMRESTGCTQCDLTHSRDVMCKSNAYSVVYVGGQYGVILNKHRHATVLEEKLVEDLVDYAFPSSVVDKIVGNHDYWVFDKVEPSEAKNFQGMCSALNVYTLNLGRGAECLQRV